MAAVLVHLEEAQLTQAVLVPPMGVVAATCMEVAAATLILKSAIAFIK